MKAADKTRVGYLLSVDGDHVATVRIGEIVSAGPVKGAVVMNRLDGIRILFVLDRLDSHPKVFIGDKQQAGALLLKPGESIHLTQAGTRLTFRFEVLSGIRVRTAQDDVCEFCRTPLAERCGHYCHATRLQPGSAGVLLCGGCANSWLKNTPI